VICRKARETDWAKYRHDLSALIRVISKNIRSRLDLELVADEMQQSVLLSFYHYCRIKLADSPRKVPWWAAELRKLRAHTRGKMAGDWDTRYNIEIIKAKRQSWRKYCQGIDQIPSGAKPMKVLNPMPETKLAL
jgi:hypothetical protein